MTTSGGTGRPTTPSDASQGAPSEASSQGNGASSTTKASSAYEVAAALRAQASRAAERTREAAQRVQGPSTSPEQDVQAKTGRADQDDGETGEHAAVEGPTGAAAAMAATAPARDRAPGHPGEDAEAAHDPSVSTPNPASQAVSGRVDTAQPANRTAQQPRQRQVRQDQSAAPQARVDAPAPAAPSAPPHPRPADDTQVSLDAKPAQQAPAPPPTQPPQPMPAPVRRTSRVRKARLRLLRVDPWSVMKTSFLLSVAIGIAIFVAVAVLWSVLDAAGVFAAVGNLVLELTASETSPGVDIQDYTALSRVLGFTTLIAVVDVVLITALATLGAFLYNLSAGLLGGLEVTLAEDD